MSGRLRFVVALGSLFLYAALGAVGLWVAVISNLSPADREVFDRVLGEQMALVVAGGVVWLLGLAVMVGLFFRAYVLPPRRLAREVQLIASANPRHRVRPAGPVELRWLAAAVNDLADRSLAAEEDVAARIEAARADLEDERNRLAALMGELTRAVIVCNAEGRILLYNDAARRLLEGGGGEASVVGLGRSLFGILDRSLVVHGLQLLRERAGARRGARSVALTATATSGQLLRVGMAPVTDREGELTGLVVMLEDMSEVAQIGGRRDALLRSLTEGTRQSTATIRAAIETLVDYPEMELAQRGRFMEIIQDEAVALGGRVEVALRESADYFSTQWSLAEILGRDLVTAIRQSLEHDARVVPGPEDRESNELWVKADSYAIVQAVRFLARRLRGEFGIEEFEVVVRREGRHARLDLGWDGPALDEEALRSWSRAPLRGDGAGDGLTLGAVVARHGGEMWCTAGEGWSWVRMLLPAADHAPARAERAPAPEVGSLQRPEFYDFDLFRAGEQSPEWADRSLAELTFTVMDTETTGMSPSNGDEIIAIGAVRILNGRILRRETFDQLVDPRRGIPAATVAIHGISDHLVRGQPTIDEVLPAFARFAGDTVLVGHNVGFDLRFLELKAERTGVRITQPVLDTLLLSAVVHPEYEHHSLEAQADRLGISVVGRHTALGDAMVTGEVFLGQLRLLAAMGITTLGDAQAAAARTYHARLSESLYSKA